MELFNVLNNIELENAMVAQHTLYPIRTTLSRTARRSTSSDSVTLPCWPGTLRSIRAR